MNHYNGIGNLTKDPVLKTLPSGDEVCDMRIAVNYWASGQQKLFLDVTAWGKSAARCAQYLKKGSSIAVSGTLTCREWEGNDGSKRQSWGVNCGSMGVTFIGGRAGKATENVNEQEQKDDPF